MNTEEHGLLKNNSSLTKLIAILVCVSSLLLIVSGYLAMGAIKDYQSRVSTNTEGVYLNNRALSSTTSRVTVLEGKFSTIEDKLSQMTSAVNNINTWVEIQKDREKRALETRR